MKKGQRKLLTQTSEGGWTAPPLLALESELYTFQLVINNKSKECLKVVKVLPDPLSQYTFLNNEKTTFFWCFKRVTAAGFEICTVSIKNILASCWMKKKRKNIIGFAKIVESLALHGPSPHGSGRLIFRHLKNSRSEKTGHGESISSNTVGLILRLPLPGKQIKVIKCTKFP